MSVSCGAGVAPLFETERKAGANGCEARGEPSWRGAERAATATRV